jgi:hypothetical protein
MNREKFLKLCRKMGLPATTPICGEQLPGILGITCTLPKGHKDAAKNPMKLHGAKDATTQLKDTGNSYA